MAKIRTELRKNEQKKNKNNAKHRIFVSKLNRQKKNQREKNYESLCEWEVQSE